MEAVASSLGLVHNLWRLAQPQAARLHPPAGLPPPACAPPAPPGRSAAPPPPPQPPRARSRGPGPRRRRRTSAPPPAAGRRPGTAAGRPLINADLGTHSPTNFYKGLSGNDIIDHGGLFVSTYMVPKLGTSVRLKVSLPGGYEFEANAVVAWSREASDGGQDAPPGFGARFTQITPEARQLIYRYVRNREPLFHDDL